MTREGLKYMVCVAVTLALAAAGYAETVQVSDFESGLDGWGSNDGWRIGILSLSSTGATSGAQAMLVEGPGGWQQMAKLDVKSYGAALGNKGAKIMADVTAFPEDMTTGWMQIEMIMNADGAIGWSSLGGQDVTLDGLPHTLEWAISDDLAATIAEGVQSLGYFELVLVSNMDGASTAKFYVDNVRIYSPDPVKAVVISDFEDGFGGWAGDGATVSLSSTTGSQAMLVEAGSGWVNAAVMDAKSLMELLGHKGVTITADVTAYPTDMATPGYFQVIMVINGQNNDDNGPNNNIDWNNLDFVDVTVDGQTRTLTWTIPDSLADKIALADQNIGWFQIFLVSNADVATKFYIDNIQINGVPAGQEDETLPKSTDMVIGNWEQQMDGWVVAGGDDVDVRYNDHNGVTLDDYSLDVWVETGAWNQDLLTLDLLDPNNAAILEAFKINTKISVDVTRLVADWPTGTDEGVDQLDWNEMLLILDAGGDDWGTDWELMTGSGNWVKGAFWLPRNGQDETVTATWDYSPILPTMDFDTMTWCRIQIGVNANDEDYTGSVLFYLDNMKLSGAGIAIAPQPANNARDVARKALLSWSGGAFATSFNVYLGTDQGAVLAADGDSDPSVTFATVDVNSFDPDGLAFNTKYFWRVDAVNDVNPDTPWTGPVWNFTVARFDVADDFESYTDDSPYRLFQAWRDGLGFSPDEFFPNGYDGNGTGSIVGYDPSFRTIVETANVHGGAQAFVMTYDNADTSISEAVRTWAEPQDWTPYERLTLWVRGLADNTADTLYVKLKSDGGTPKMLENADASILTSEEWTEWPISTSDFTGVSLAMVTEMTIGVGSMTNPKASSGTLFVDDIRLYPRVSVTLDPDHLEVQRTSVAPAIDGVGDGIWDEVVEVPMLITEMSNTSSAAPEDAADLSASFKVLYDDTNFYLFVEILDSVVDTTYSDYQGDGIEVYFDGDYSHGDTYDGINDNQIRITVGDVVLADTEAPLEVPGMQFQVLRTAGGYNIEAAFPLAELQIYPSEDPSPLLDANGDPVPGTGIAPNNVIGFEMQINDDDGGGRQTLMRWHSDDNNSYQNPSLFGQARLVQTTVGN